MSLPPKFLGRPHDPLRRFIYQLSISALITQAKSDQAKVVIASRLLGGEALDWYLDLLHSNAEQAVLNANLAQLSVEPGAGSGAERGLERVTEWDPLSWTKFPFVVEELSSWDGFLKAIWDRFGDSEVETVAESRASTPQSEATIDLLTNTNAELPPWPTGAKAKAAKTAKGKPVKKARS